MGRNRIKSNRIPKPIDWLCDSYLNFRNINVGVVIAIFGLVPCLTGVVGIDVHSDASLIIVGTADLEPAFLVLDHDSRAISVIRNFRKLVVIGSLVFLNLCVVLEVSL